MNTIAKNLKKNDLVFTFLLLALVLFPIALKLVFTGNVGPTFSFYYFVLWLPAVTLSFSALRGWQAVAYTGVFIISAFLISFISYPFDPPMDFRRQIVNQLDTWIVLALVASWGVQIVFPRLGT